MDGREWRDYSLEKLRWRMDEATELANLTAKRDIAVMIILLGFASGAILAGVTQQAPLRISLGLAIIGLLGSASVAALLGRHTTRVHDAVESATREADTFMREEVEPEHDAPPDLR